MNRKSDSGLPPSPAAFCSTNTKRGGSSREKSPPLLLSVSSPSAFTTPAQFEFVTSTEDEAGVRTAPGGGFGASGGRSPGGTGG